MARVFKSLQQVPICSIFRVLQINKQFDNFTVILSPEFSMLVEGGFPELCPRKCGMESFLHLNCVLWSQFYFPTLPQQVTLTGRINFALLQGVANLNKAIMDLVNIEIKWPSLEILVAGLHGLSMYCRGSILDLANLNCSVSGTSSRLGNGWGSGGIC